MIRLSAITKTYNAGHPNEVTALGPLDLTLEGGALTVLAGASGSGKTTLVTLVGCLARPTSGRVTLRGEPISGLPERFLTEVRRATFGFVFQRFNLVRGITALENVMLPAYPAGVPHARLKARALALMAELGVDHRAGFRVEMLSGGEVQRIAIARALINDPQVIIADEPTANLDGDRVTQFLDIVTKLKAGGKTIIVTSHDPRVIEAAAVDRVVRLADGQIAEGAA